VALPNGTIVDTCFSNITTEEDLYNLQNLIAGIKTVQSPIVTEDYIIFTADKNARFTGIAFDFENYTKIHTFQRLITRDSEFEPVDSLLFYICKIPEKTTNISYRLIIDGIWTYDPINENKYYSYEADTYFSVVKIENPKKEKTEKILAAETAHSVTGHTRFVYLGKPGEKIRLGGTFTNWDSFIYELEETSPGFYEITLALPKGSYFYAYYKGTTSFVDETNPDKAYTPDGRIASVLHVN
jgi:hypothetical protein